MAAGEFPPHVLREYALIADGERGALIGPRGDISWLCVPRWHSDAVFASLIGGGGVYSVTPAERFVWGGYYEEGSLIWRGRWITSSGVVECRDALAFPGDRDTAVILRRLSAIDCAATLRVVLDPRAGFGARALRAAKRDDAGRWTAQAGEVYLRWSGDTGGARVQGGRQGPRLVTELAVPPGGQRDLVLELSSRRFTEPPPEPDRLWHVTEEQWAGAVPRLENVLATRDARHAYAVMRGLTSASGGMVAAATTSLPERAEAGRNYDYRYAWIRDQCFAGHAAAAAGAYPLLDEAVKFVGTRLLADGPKL
ncbi:MAG: glycoside hydrolase family 15 protein, partial [Actinobacteria bacterium]|nr:glycoside hydrolase family 15 protein [Actinomycetota bacterium]